jgi:hypothetical protein
MSQQGTTPGPRDERAEYDAPRVERLLTPADLEREILYAGPTDLVSETDRP